MDKRTLILDTMQELFIEGKAGTASVSDIAKQAGIAGKGDTVVLTAGLPLGETGNTNMIRVFEVF